MEAFIKAIGDEDVEKVRAMVPDVDVNDNSEGIRPLVKAVQCNNTELVRLLLEHGSEINPEDLVTCITISPIVHPDNKDILRLLLSNGADPYTLFSNGEDEYGYFGYDADTNVNAIVKAVEASINESYIPDEAKATPRESVRILLDHDNGLGEPEAKGPYGLYAAVALGDMDLVKRYFNDGVRVEHCYELSLNPLLEACRNKDLELATLLLERGANPNETDKPNIPYDTPLHIAMRDENMQLVRLLLGRGADDAGMPIYWEGSYDMTRTDDRLTGLMYACAWGLLDMVREVLAHGRDVNAMNTEGHSALFYCNDVQRCLVESCPRVDATTNLAIIRELLKAGAHCTIENPLYEDGYRTILADFLSGVVFQDNYHDHTTNLSGITAPALMLKAYGSSSESLEPFIEIMNQYLQASEEKCEKIFIHEKSFYNFNSLFQIVILCGNKPTREFVDKYREVVLKGTGKVDDAYWLKDIADSGYSLKELARIKLREIIAHPLVTNAVSETITLPQLLKKYILFDEILPFCT